MLNELRADTPEFLALLEKIEIGFHQYFLQKKREIDSLNTSLKEILSSATFAPFAGET